ncbi:hypothetical protein [uncultured Ruegeria sp.]|jgi:hypothetical protein|uniref:hypothetical protein n=2 Tax=uncultured Ruegeria sp. TaxID=259304 RepID=UPI002604F4FE|nr:hypothetical protein [uncultured Ruegeria sp.]
MPMKSFLSYLMDNKVVRVSTSDESLQGNSVFEDGKQALEKAEVEMLFQNILKEKQNDLLTDRK